MMRRPDITDEMIEHATFNWDTTQPLYNGRKVSSKNAIPEPLTEQAENTQLTAPSSVRK